MGFRLPGTVNTKKSLIQSLSTAKTLDIPKGYFAVYVGKKQMKRFVIPVSYLNQPLFLDLLSQAEEEFGYDHPMDGITIPCSEATFLDLTSRLSVCMNTNEVDLGSETSSIRNLLPSQDADKAMTDHPTEWTHTCSRNTSGTLKLQLS